MNTKIGLIFFIFCLAVTFVMVTHKMAECRAAQVVQL